MGLPSDTGKRRSPVGIRSTVTWISYILTISISFVRITKYGCVDIVTIVLDMIGVFVETLFIINILFVKAVRRLADYEVLRLGYDVRHICGTRWELNNKMKLRLHGNTSYSFQFAFGIHVTVLKGVTQFFIVILIYFTMIRIEKVVGCMSKVRAVITLARRLSTISIISAKVIG